MGLCSDLLLQPRMLLGAISREVLSFRHKDHSVLHAVLNWPDEVLGICGGADRSKDDHLSGEHESTKLREEFFWVSSQEPVSTQFIIPSNLIGPSKFIMRHLRNNFVEEECSGGG